MHRVGEREAWDPFPPTVREGDLLDRRDAHRAIAVSAAGLALTGAAELVVAALSGSVGLLGDALHNLSDVSTSVAVFVGFRVSKRPASPTHTYGWERAEDLAGLGVALVIWASAVLAAVLSLDKLLRHGTTSHIGPGIAAAIVGIIGNQLVARYKLRVGRRINSTTLVADARHSWLDALSSAGALAGLVCVATGLRWADAVAGLLVTGFIVHVGVEVTRGLVHHLMDGVDEEVVKEAAEAAGSVPGVDHAHVRARWMGRSLIVEVEGFLSSAATMQQAEELREPVEAAVAAAVPQVRAVLWYPRPWPS